eukprot:6639144-Pyramimonas_sp.AAC.1
MASTANCPHSAVCVTKPTSDHRSSPASENLKPKIPPLSYSVCCTSDDPSDGADRCRACGRSRPNNNKNNNKNNAASKPARKANNNRTARALRLQSSSSSSTTI